MASYKELLAQKEELEKNLEEAKAREIKTVVAEIRTKIAEYDLTIQDLGLSAKIKKRSKAASNLLPKYRNWETGETWSGRGKAPKWIGKNKEKFLVE
jgi:DNA-binding protein H-NS